MITRKLIIWMTNIVIVISLILIVLELLYVNHKVGSYIFIPIIGIELFLILVGIIGTLFGLDNPAFLQSYDNIKVLEKNLQAQSEVVAEHIIIIGQHEAIKLWNAAKSDLSQIEKDGELVIDYAALTKSWLKKQEEVVATNLEKGVQFIEKIPEEYFDSKLEPTPATVAKMNKDATPIKEVFEEKASTNINEHPMTPDEATPVSIANTAPISSVSQVANDSNTLNPDNQNRNLDGRV